jgi:hypothetical protein
MNLSQPAKHAERLVGVGLWHQTPTGYTVHDFLDWNPSRADAMKALEADRRRKGKERSVSEWNPEGQREDASRDRADTRARALSSERSSSEESPRETTDADAERAGRFMDTYQAIYAKVRHGAHYPLKPNRDYLHAIGLVKAYPDDTRLAKMAEVYLLRNDREVEGKARTVGEFAHMAPWCDARLREAGL